MRCLRAGETHVLENIRTRLTSMTSFVFRFCAGPIPEALGAVEAPFEGDKEFTGERRWRELSIIASRCVFPTPIKTPAKASTVRRDANASCVINVVSCAECLFRVHLWITGIYKQRSRAWVHLVVKRELIKYIVKSSWFDNGPDRTHPAIAVRPHSILPQLCSLEQKYAKI